MSTTLTYLLETHGPLIPMDALAKLLDRSPQGVRISLSSDSELARGLRNGRKKIGRRVYYKSDVVAQFIDEDLH